MKLSRNRVGLLAAAVVIAAGCTCSGTGIGVQPDTPVTKPAAAPASGGDTGEEVVQETALGDFTIVRLHKQPGSKLSALIAAEAEKAAGENLKPFLEFDATWCGPCIAIQTTLDEGDPLMLDAFAGTYIIRVDIDEWDSDIPGAGYETPAIPLYFELGPNGKPTGREIDGGAWGDNIAENMAPPLKAFFEGS